MTFPFQPIISHYNFEKLSIFLRSAVVLNNFKLTLVVFFSFVTFSKWFQIAMNWKRRKVFAFFGCPESNLSTCNICIYVIWVMFYVHIMYLLWMYGLYLLYVVLTDVWATATVVCRNYIHSLFFFIFLSQNQRKV